VSAVAELMEMSNSYSTRFEQMESESDRDGRAWLLPVRRSAFTRFSELGFPTTRNEEWRFTNVAPIAKGNFAPAERDVADVSDAMVASLALPRESCSLLVFVNGRYSPQLSSTAGLPNGVSVSSLAEAIRRGNECVKAHLAQHAAFDDHAFAALNTAMLEDGVFIHAAKGVVVERPIQCLFVSVPDEPAMSTHPRILIVGEATSQLTVIESYVGAKGGTYFTNPVTEVVAGDGAVIDCYKVLRESDEAFHVGVYQINQARDTHVSLHVSSLSGGLVRNDISTVLDGEGGDCHLTGVTLLDGKRHVDNHLVVDHAKPHCDSREYFKAVLDGASRSVFSGRINVRKDAQKTDAKQTNMSLLLSAEAQVESKPQLEILADDVKCTHGATIGQVDDEAIFYLQSRGLHAAAARKMLIRAFVGECVDLVKVEPLRLQLDEMMVQALQSEPRR
jgi:Fe-S cluster assembly protein SufD